MEMGEKKRIRQRVFFFTYLLDYGKSTRIGRIGAIISNGLKSWKGG